MLELRSTFVEQQDGEHLVVDDSRDKVADAFQQLVEIEDRRELAADLIEQDQCLGLLGDSSIETRILDADRYARGNNGQQVAMLFGEEIRS